jgi:hypothetical protein
VFCHAIFGVFCVALPIGNSTAAMQNMGVGGVVSVTTPSWYASLGMGTDTSQLLNPTKLAQLCANGQCIQYWRHCKPTQDKKINCDFSFVQGNTSITAGFIADTQYDEDMALAGVGYIQNIAKPDDAIPMTQFNVESAIAVPPVCDNYSDTPPDKGCPAKQQGPVQ